MSVTGAALHIAVGTALHQDLVVDTARPPLDVAVCDADCTKYVCLTSMHMVACYLLQGKDVKHAATFVSQVRRAGNGHGVFHIDSLLMRQYGGGNAGADGAGDGAEILAGPLFA